jgi:hypothetical protein
VDSAGNNAPIDCYETSGARPTHFGHAYGSVAAQTHSLWRSRFRSSPWICAGRSTGPPTMRALTSLLCAAVIGFRRRARVEVGAVADLPQWCSRTAASGCARQAGWHSFPRILPRSYRTRPRRFGMNCSCLVGAIGGVQRAVVICMPPRARAHERISSQTALSVESPGRRNVRFAASAF